MGQALYRKYRSKSLDEIIGQEHITQTLKNAISSGKISHAYLFTGPRGVGKTSIARILAHELNNVPYTGEDTHLDIIEIDAASNGGVEEVRDLRDKIFITPSTGKYKVYIIDEVHMMTTSAFNALLKTLEEPPAHAIFILATTEAHKLPTTIISRTQRFTFKPIPSEQMVEHLQDIAKKEHINIDSDAIKLLAVHSEGSFRDAISMLDQLGSSGKKINVAMIETVLSIPSKKLAEGLLESITAADAVGLTSILADLVHSGYQAAAIAKQLGTLVRSRLVEGTLTMPTADALSLLTKLLDVPASRHADQLLEIVLLGATLQPQPSRVASAVTSPATPDIPPPMQFHAPIPTTPNRIVAPQSVLVETLPSRSPDSGPNDTAYTVTATDWQQLVEALKKEYNTLYGIVRMARPEFLPGKVILTFGFAFHQKRANDPKNKKILITTLEEICGARIAIDCKFDKSVTPPAPLITTPIAIAASASLGTINSIFGGGEVIQP